MGAQIAVVPCQGPGVASLALSARVAGILSCPRGYHFGRRDRGQANPTTRLTRLSAGTGPAREQGVPRTSFWQGARWPHGTEYGPGVICGRWCGRWQAVPYRVWPKGAHCRGEDECIYGVYLTHYGSYGPFSRNNGPFSPKGCPTSRNNGPLSRNNGPLTVTMPHLAL